tara:strand:- start:608 stop:3013 length:2406 start_codon:yes stop_codon:yes gene_type:complete
MANLFRGYAQKSDYSGNLLKGIDPSDKILEEGRRHLLQWKDVSQGEQQNQQNYLAALEAKFQAEEADRARNQKLETYFADSFGKALTKRHEGLIQNAEANLLKAQETTKKLKGWSDTAVNVGMAAASGFAEARREHGMNLAMDLGLSWDTAKGIQDATGVLDETYKGTNAAVLEARKRGASWEQINQIHSLSFLGNQGFRVGVAMNIGENYRVNGILKKQNKKYNFKGRQMSLLEATSELNLEAYTAIQRKVTSEYLKEEQENSGLHIDLITKYARDPIIRANGRVKTTIHEAIIKQQKEGEQRKLTKLTETKIKEGIYWPYVKSRFGPNNENRAGVLSSEHNNQMDAFKSGLLTSVDLEYIKNMEIEINGKKILYGNKFPKRITELENALNSHTNILYNKQQRATKIRQNELIENTELFRQELLRRETPIKPGELASMIAEANRLHGPDNVMSKMLVSQTRDYTSEANDKIYKPTLEKLEKQGMVTASVVKSYGLTPKTEAKWMKVARMQDRTQPTEAEIKILESTVKTRVEDILNDYGFDSEDVSSSALAIYVGQNRIKKYFTTYAQDPKLNRGDVLLQAIERFEVDVKKDYQIKTTGKGDTYKPHFVTFSVSAKRHPIPLSEITSEEFAANPRLAYEKLFLEPVKLVKYFDDVAQGRNVGIPPEAANYVSKFGIGPKGEVRMTELMFLEAQRKLIDPDFQIPPHLLQMHKVAFNQIKPEYQKYITGAHQTTNSAHVALKYSGFKHPDAETSNNFAEKNTQSYFNMFRNPENFHFYLNIDPKGVENQLDWTEQLIMGVS